jgi:hypothetical protein
MRVEIQQFQKQSIHTASSKGAFSQHGSATAKGTERPVTGKASIKTLIKVATARD